MLYDKVFVKLKKLKADNFANRILELIDGHDELIKLFKGSIGTNIYRFMLLLCKAFERKFLFKLYYSLASLLGTARGVFYE